MGYISFLFTARCIDSILNTVEHIVARAAGPAWHWQDHQCAGSGPPAARPGLQRRGAGAERIGRPVSADASHLTYVSALL